MECPDTNALDEIANFLRVERSLSRDVAPFVANVNRWLRELEQIKQQKLQMSGGVEGHAASVHDAGLHTAEAETAPEVPDCGKPVDRLAGIKAGPLSQLLATADLLRALRGEYAGLVELRSDTRMAERFLRKTVATLAQLPPKEVS